MLNLKKMLTKISDKLSELEPYRNLQVSTQGGVSCLTGVALSGRGCF